MRVSRLLSERHFEPKVSSDCVSRFVASISGIGGLGRWRGLAGRATLRCGGSIWVRDVVGMMGYMEHRLLQHRIHAI